MLKSDLFLTVHVRTRSLSPWLEGEGRARWGRANWGKVGRVDRGVDDVRLLPCTSKHVFF